MSEGQGRQARSAVVILARTDSTRLSRKSLRKIAGKSILEHQIERLVTTRRAARVILATTALAEDDELCRLAETCGVDCFRGDEEDVVLRLLQAADRFEMDFLAVLGGDNMFCEGALVDAVIAEFERDPADFIRIAKLPFDSSPFGVKVEALRDVMTMKAGSTDGWERYFLDTGRFRVSHIPANDPATECPNLRLELDYPEDLELFTKVYDRLYRDGRQPSLRDVVRLLAVDEPELAEINRTAAERWQQNRDQTPLQVKNGEPQENAE